MADYISTQSGNWSSNSTWGGSGHPGDGDTATISDTHVVTIDGYTVVGTSPATNENVITGAGSGSLIIGTGVHIVSKGGIHTYSGSVTMNAGSHIEFVAPVDTQYRLYPGLWNAPNANLVANGVLGNRCKISCSGAGSAYFYHNIGADDGHSMPMCSLNYTDLEYLGNASTPAIHEVGGLTMQHCRVSHCGLVYLNGASIAQDVNIEYCNFSNGVNGSDPCQDVSIDTTRDAPNPGVLRRIRYNSFSNQAVFFALRGVAIVENYFGMPPNHPVPVPTPPVLNAYFPATWDGNFIRDAQVALAGIQFVPKCSLVQNDYFYNVTADDPLVYLPWLISHQEFDGLVIEGRDWGPLDNGDWFLSTINPYDAYNYTIHNCIELPSPGRKCSVSIFTSCGTANMAYRVYNNTFFAGERGGAYVADDFPGKAGSIEYFRNNIGWADVGSTEAYLLREQPATHTSGYVTQCDYNGYVNLNANRYIISSTLCADAYGVHDLHADPIFVDKDRNLSKWAHVVLGNPSSDGDVLRAAAVAALASMNDESAAAYVPGVSVKGFTSWVKAGFAPTNPLFKTASSTGSFIGAVAPVTLNIAASLMMSVF